MHRLSRHKLLSNLVEGVRIVFAYNYQGKVLNEQDMFFQNVHLDYGYHSVAQTNYTVLRVFKKRLDGTYQYPFARDVWAGGTKGGKSCYQLATEEGWYLALNGGVNEGLCIQNGVLVTDTPPTTHSGAIPLTIDSNGDLGYVASDTTGTGQSLINNGIVSAVCGFFPIIVDYDNYNYPGIAGRSVSTNERAQRNIIGQFENGDYCIITAEGRNYANSAGFTIPQMQDFCKTLGLKFAYNLDGGGSTQTVLGLKNLNHIYENETGRTLASAIVFNGKSTYEPPISN